MAPKVHSCENYLELKPHDATLLDPVRIMFTSDNSLAMEKSVETSEPNHLRGLELRWVIFISLSVQKLLLYLKKPMAWLGYVIEMCLKLLSSNGGFWWLLLNILKGAVVKPDKSSAKFVSVLGCIIGTRVELDKNIETTDDRSGAALSIMASKLAYEHQAFGRSVIIGHWKMDVLGWFNFWNGHGLGGALAILFAAGLVLHEEKDLLESLDWVYTFGQPMVGNEQFGNWMGEKMRIYDVMREEPNENYFSFLWAIPKNQNAVLELVRSLILPYMCGLDYKEIWSMTLVRLFGTLIPGLAAHCPQDYDIAIRIGFFPSESILAQQVVNGNRD
ncbi:hypothetical protein RHSIM_Rhsim06G0051100 [Rhododendron simsii]|uniref:Fungal lipase-type domain-containing protein n=1 Tax=Rhododendron simsii TaxID=118357 RepID=A0A834GS94_RHOSS|nr:hypothetical protein RHSIM_Rhsim06G0051100 [Rhododendron simsii]